MSAREQVVSITNVDLQIDKTLLIFGRCFLYEAREFRLAAFLLAGDGSAGEVDGVCWLSAKWDGSLACESLVVVSE